MAELGSWAESLQQGYLMFGISSTLSSSQLSLDVPPATCHNNIMKQTMVDSSCRILTSDIFQGCNRLVRLCGWREEDGLKACGFLDCECLMCTLTRLGALK